MSLLSSIKNEFKSKIPSFFSNKTQITQLSDTAVLNRFESKGITSNPLRNVERRQSDQSSNINQEARNHQLIQTNPSLSEVLQGERVLKKSPLSSNEVSVVQDLLKQHGAKIDDKKGQNRGIFGPQTEKAVRQFQIKNGLTADGIVGSKTLSSLLGINPSSQNKTSAVKKVEASLTKKEFFEKYASYATASQKETGVPASVTLAQAALESGWGKHAPGNNFFGIKGSGPAGSQSLRTWEHVGGKDIHVNANFRKYNSPLESFVDHARVISNSKYLKHAMEHTSSPYDFISSLQSGTSKYATDPNYVEKISSLIKNYNLEQYDVK